MMDTEARASISYGHMSSLYWNNKDTCLTLIRGKKFYMPLVKSAYHKVIFLFLNKTYVVGTQKNVSMRRFF